MSAGDEIAAETTPERPLLQVVRGIPDGTDPSVEIAVLTAVLATRGGPPPAERGPRSVWGGRPTTPGADGWWASALPH